MKKSQTMPNVRPGSCLRLVRCLVFYCALTFTAAPVFSQFNVLMSPHVAQLELRPGQRTTVSFDITNQEPELALAIRLFAKDSYQGSEGEYRVSDTAMPYSCVSWLTLPDTLIEIPPGGSRQVTVAIAVPAKTVGGAYGAVVFEFAPTTERRDVPDAMLTRFDYRLQVPAWLEITIKSFGGLNRRLVPGQIAVTPTAEVPELEKRFGDQGLRISMDVKNEGNVHVYTDGRLIIRDKNRRLVRDTKLGSGRGLVLPGVKTPLRSVLRMPEPGQYTLKVFVEYGGRSPLTAQTSFEISPDKRSRADKSEAAMPLFVEYRPEAVDQSIPAGGSRTFAINMLNREDEPVGVDISLAPLTYTADGQMWISGEEPDTGRTCVSWLKLDPARFTLDPNRRQNIRVVMSVPDTASGGYYACVALNTRLTNEANQTTLSTPYHIPIRVSVPPKLEPNGEITSIKVNQTGKIVTLNTEFRNTGNIHKVIKGRANILKWVVPEEVEGIEVMSTAKFQNLLSIPLETDSTYVLPGGTRLISSQSMQGLRPGRYKAEVIVNYGGEKPATSEREFTVE